MTRRQIPCRPRGGRARTALAPADRGESLVELLVSISIMGVAVVAILGAIAMTATTSGLHRDTASVQNLLHNWAESFSTVTDASYKPCATPAEVQSTFPAPQLPNSWTARVSDARYWTNGSFSTGCTVGSDSGVQRFTLEIVGAGSPAASGDLDVVLRRPCETAC